MANYSSFFQSPDIKHLSQDSFLNLGNMRSQDTFDEEAFDKMIAGHDETSGRYVEKLKGIYDTYAEMAGDYSEDMQPILDAMGGDIDKMQGAIGDYADVVGGMEDTFMNGIKVDPNAAHYRAEYMGNTANQFGAQEEAIRQRLASQGINPYGMAGANREMGLSKAAAMAGSANKAYRDWRDSHNKDVQAKQAGMATYAGIAQGVPTLYGQAAGVRSGMANTRSGVYDTTLKAAGMKAAGYEGLLDHEENRRAEALSMGQRAADTDAQGKAFVSQTMADRVAKNEAKKPQLYISGKRAY